MFIFSVVFSCGSRKKANLGGSSNVEVTNVLPLQRLTNLRQEASSLSCSKKSRSPLRLSLRAEIPWSDHRTRCTKKRAFLCILHDRPKAIAMGPSHVFLMNNVKGFVKGWEPSASNKWQVTALRDEEAGRLQQVSDQKKNIWLYVITNPAFQAWHQLKKQKTICVDNFLHFCSQVCWYQ